MKELYSLANTDYKYIDFFGVYPRINYLQDTLAQKIRKWYDFGIINSIYLSPPNFSEISLLPSWVQEGAKDFYMNNPTIGPKDILVLKFMSAGPDYYQEERYPAYHFIRIGKVESFSINTYKDKKEYKKYDENDIHCRRAIGIRIILQGLEGSFKKGFRRYGGKKIHSSIMISPARKTPVVAERYVQTKIKLLDKGIIKSSPTSQQRICYYRKHQLDTCPTCTRPEKDNHKKDTVAEKDMHPKKSAYDSEEESG